LRTERLAFVDEKSSSEIIHPNVPSMRHISVIPSALGHKDKDGKITQKGKREGCESFKIFTKKFSDFIHVNEKRG
jgi:hypothetical protein